MKYEAKAWKETEGACLRNFNEQAQIDSVNGALALRPQIEKIIDQIWEEGFSVISSSYSTVAMKDSLSILSRLILT